MLGRYVRQNQKKVCPCRADLFSKYVGLADHILTSCKKPIPQALQPHTYSIAGVFRHVTLPSYPRVIFHWGHGRCPAQLLICYTSIRAPKAFLSGGLYVFLLPPCWGPSTPVLIGARTSWVPSQDLPRPPTVCRFFATRPIAFTPLGGGVRLLIRHTNALVLWVLFSPNRLMFYLYAQTKKQFHISAIWWQKFFLREL